MPSLAIPLVLAGVTLGADSPAMVLVGQGQPRAVVVVADGAPLEVTRGAQELAHYIGQIAGCQVAVVRPAEVGRHAGGVRIHVGLNPLVKGRSPDVARCEKDGAWIKTLGPRDLVIAGKTPYGTEFGVYGLLERFCGVRWYLPGPNGTHVPRQRTLTLPRIDLLDNPVFISRSYSAPTLWDSARYPCPTAQEMDLEWARHNRLRRHFHASHNLGRIIVPSKYGKAHPEYFPVIDGKRYVPASDRPVGFQPCMTNDDVVRICAEAAAKQFDAEPDRLSFSIGINDWGGFCQCPACAKVNGPARLNSRGLPDYSRLLFHFGNRVAAALPDRHKDRYVGLIAYAQARDLPQGTKIHPNLLVARVTAFVAYFSPMDRADMDETRRFAQACRMFGVYDYWYGTGYVIPVFCTGLMEEYIDFLARLGCKGWNSEIYPNWAMDGIKYRLLSRKLWDPSLRVRDMLGAFCRDMFDAGAPDMLAFYDGCRRLWETQTFATSKYHLQRSVRQLVLFDEPTCASLMGLLTAARAKTANPKGRYLLDRFIQTFGLTQTHARLLRHALAIADHGPTPRPAVHDKHREEDVIPADGFRKPIADLDAYAEHVMAALRLVHKMNAQRSALRRDVFSLPRTGLASPSGLLCTPETIAAPLLTAYDAAGRTDDKRRLLALVEKEMPGIWPKVQWVATHLTDMAGQPELLPNGSFEQLDANRYDAQGWLHGNWGSKRSTANGFVVPQGVDGRHCYYLVGIKNAFTYLPSPVIRTAQPVPVEAGKWYLARAVGALTPQRRAAAPAGVPDQLPRGAPRVALVQPERGCALVRRRVAVPRARTRQDGDRAVPGHGGRGPDMGRCLQPQTRAGRDRAEHRGEDRPACVSAPGPGRAPGAGLRARLGQARPGSRLCTGQGP